MGGARICTYLVHCQLVRSCTERAADQNQILDTFFSLKGDRRLTILTSLPRPIVVGRYTSEAVATIFKNRNLRIQVDKIKGGSSAGGGLKNAAVAPDSVPATKT